MKRRVRRLQLHRETVGRLEDGSLRQVAGGQTQDHTFCLTDCPWCPTDQMTAMSACYAC
jgi:hypothetical protein